MIELLQSHTSVRKFTNEKISQEVLEELILSGQHASSSHFVQAYSVIHVTDDAKKEKLKELSNNHVQIDTAPVTLVFCADLKRLEKAAAIREEPFEGSTAESTVVTLIDTALFAQNVAIAAESKGYGICYIGGVRNDIAGVSELLELPDLVVPLFAMTIGVPERRNEVKPRLPISAVLHENAYDEEKTVSLLAEYDDVMNTYYAKRSSNRKDATWTNDMARFFSKPRRDHMKQFLEEKGFFLK